MAKKHRLIFLVTIAVGLILFYFGIDTWMQQKENQQKTLPPVVLHKPVPQQKQEIVEKPKKEEEPRPKKSEEEKRITAKKEEKKTPSEAPQKGIKREKETKKEQRKEEKKIEKKEPVKKETVKKETKKLRTYKFQIGAFRIKENAYRMLKKARSLGFRAELRRKGQLYRVYVYAKAENYRKALRIVRKHFKDAVPVRG